MRLTHANVVHFPYKNARAFAADMLPFLSFD